MRSVGSQRRGPRAAAASAFAVSILACGVATAAPPSSRAAVEARENQGSVTISRGDTGGRAAGVARQRARAGDCAGALAMFDSAARSTIEPSIRRDRGLCHEKLGHPFPAIDDYRAYLVARPDAADADSIRARLARLEEQVGVGGPSSQAVKDNPDVLGPKPGEPERDYDYYAAIERRADAAEDSPLRYGRGIIVGAFASVPRYFLGDGATKDLGYAAGGTLRYSTGPTLSVMGEVAFAGIGTQGSSTSLSGPLLFGGLELRIPVTKYADDQLLLGAGLGFERYTVSGTRVASNYWLGRGRLGFRHIFGPQLGVELDFDGGPAYVAPDDGGDSRINVLLGGSLAVLVGF